MEIKSWAPVKMFNDCPRISHLFFANDVLLFAKAQPGQAKIISNILEEFCSFSSLKVSKEKSHTHTHIYLDN